MAMEFENNEWVLICASCGTRRPQAWVKKEDGEACSSCGVVKDSTPRDAIGQKIRIPTDRLGTYSHAYGTVVRSAEHASQMCKESGLALRNG